MLGATPKKVASSDREAKTTAMKEIQLADEMMANKDMRTCMAHMHNAMEAIEK